MNLNSIPLPPDDGTTDLVIVCCPSEREGERGGEGGRGERGDRGGGRDGIERACVCVSERERETEREREIVSE